MTPLFRRLHQLDERRSPIRVGIIGIGLMGRGLVHQLARMPGMTPSLIVARNVERAVSAYRAASRDQAAFAMIVRHRVVRV